MFKWATSNSVFSVACRQVFICQQALQEPYLLIHVARYTWQYNWSLKLVSCIWGFTYAHPLPPPGASCLKVCRSQQLGEYQGANTQSPISTFFLQTRECFLPQSSYIIYNYLQVVAIWVEAVIHESWPYHARMVKQKSGYTHTHTTQQILLTLCCSKCPWIHLQCCSFCELQLSTRIHPFPYHARETVSLRVWQCL